MKNLTIIFALIVIFFGAAAAQNNKTLVRSVPACDTLNVSALGQNLEIIGTLETFSRIEVETSLNNSLNAQTAAKIHSVLGVSYGVNETYKGNTIESITVNVAPVKSDELFSVSVGGTDIDMKRSYTLYVPKGTVIIR
jgi:hypothetical protein